MHTVRTPFGAGLAILVTALSAGPAFAGTGSVSGGVATYNGTAGEINNVTASVVSSHLRLTDTVGITPTATCTVISSTSVDCGLISAITQVNLNGNDQNDTISGSASLPATVPLSILGGPGGDTMSGGPASDTFDGGGGTDTIDYSASSVTSAAADFVSVDLSNGSESAGGTNNSGSDTIVLNSVENVVGSAGNDSIIGDANPNTLNGGPGADTLQPKAGNDTVDGGTGSNTVSYSQAAAPVSVNLGAAAPQVSDDGDGGSDTLVNIENATGSGNQDSLVGDGGANILSGGGNDDAITGDAGNDTLNGGTGNDTVSYGSSIATAPTDGVSINLAAVAPQETPIGTNNSGSDTLTSIENVNGSFYADTITGNASANTFSTGFGNDTIRFSDGGDTVDGGIGTDTMSYVTSPSAVTIDLGITGVPQGATNDSLANLENLTGSPQGDTLTGDSNDNVLSGGNGSDTLAGRGGFDTLDGGTGTNTASYSGAAAAVIVNLGASAPQAGNDGDGATDTFTLIQKVIGSAFNDTLTGDSGINTLTGGGGNDTLNATAGGDVLDGGLGSDTVSYAAFASGVSVDLGSGSGNGGLDTLVAMDNVVGSSHDDVLQGDGAPNSIDGGAGADTLIGAGGADTLTGGSGTDVADYSAAPAGVTVDLGTGTASNDGFGSSDTLVAVEDLAGSSHADTLTGDAGSNAITGNDGADVITGGEGADTLDGGLADDDMRSRDSSADAVLCGAGAADRVTPDATDTLSACEFTAATNTAAPAVSGTPQEGQALTATHGTWLGSPGPTFASQWQRCDASGQACADIAGANGDTYTPTADDVGSFLRVLVTGTNFYGSDRGAAIPIGPVTAAPPASGPAPGTGSPAPTPTPLALSLAVPKQGLKGVLAKGLKLTVKCSAACSASVLAQVNRALAKKLKLAAAKPLTLASVRGKLTKAGTLKLTIKLSKKARKALAKAKSLTIGLKLTALDSAGHAAKPVTRSIKLKR